MFYFDSIFVFVPGCVTCAGRRRASTATTEVKFARAVGHSSGGLCKASESIILMS
jgi:hypothetical protein